jgi:2-desacetyl-2-hydroxyethyl bacteriochlorophyllide A dehydrogenase
VARALVLEGPRKVRMQDGARRALGPRDVRIGTLMSGVSHGTELSLYRGTSAFASRVFDRELRAFVRPDPPRPAYPATLGYELVGRVTEVGDRVTEFAEGDLVHVGAPHAEEAVLDVDEAAMITYPLVRLPDGPPLERWLFVSTGAVALVAMHDARLKLGDHVCIVGLGAIGLMAVQMARLAGAARVTAVDPVESRRDLALALGADATVDPAADPEHTAVVIKRAAGGADVAVETSGATAGLHDAIAAARLGGTVVTVGFYQGGAPQLRLGEEWHHNRLDMVSSMGAWGATHRAYPAWDRPRVIRTVVELLGSGAVAVDALPVRRFRFAEAAAGYRWLDAHPREAVKVALAYGDGNRSAGGEQ